MTAGPQLLHYYTSGPGERITINPESSSLGYMNEEREMLNGAYIMHISFWIVALSLEVEVNTLNFSVVKLYSLRKIPCCNTMHPCVLCE